MIRVGIVGATGYTALELIKILLRHPEVEIVALTSRQEGRPHVSHRPPSVERAAGPGRWRTWRRPRWPPGATASSAACRTVLRRRWSRDLLDAGIACRRLQRRLPAGRRPSSTASGTRSEAPRPGAAGPGGLRSAGAVPRADPRGRAGGQSGLLSDVGHPALAPLLKERLIDERI